jgi:hypothetical protein
MRSRCFRALRLTVLVVAFVPSCRAKPGAVDVADLLPPDGCVASVMIPVLHPVASEVAEKLKRAAQQDTEWWFEYAKGARDGEPLPYHPKMGVSEKEYEDFLRLGKEEMEVKQVGEVRLVVSRGEGGAFRLSTHGELWQLDGIEIDLQRDEVRTPFGVARGHSSIEATPEQKATGPWSGVQWKFAEGDVFAFEDASQVNACTMTFALGRLQESGQGILYYNAIRILPGPAKDRAMVVLYFPPKAAAD